MLLYELLTGSTPLTSKRAHEAGLGEILRIIRDEEPPTPSMRLSDSRDALASISAQRQTEPAKLASLLRGEIDCIVMACLEKDRTRRYESAAALAKDVQHFLADEPVERVPPSAAYRLGKFARRHGAALVIAGAFVLVLVVGLIFSVWQTARATRAEQQAQDDRDQSRKALTRQIANRLDAEMRQLAVFGTSIEAALAHQPDWNAKQLEGFLADLLRGDDRIHGLTLAYAAGRSPAKQEPHCLYVYRSLADPKLILTANLIPKNGYKPHLTQPWYLVPFGSGLPQWTGPTFDGANGNKTWMVAYAVPMRLAGEIVGVVTVDVRTKSFIAYQSWLTELNPGKERYGCVVDCTPAIEGKMKGKPGLFVCHPIHGAGDRENQQPGDIADLKEIDSDLAERILKGETGQGTGIHPKTGNRLTFLFHPVHSAKWSFVAVIEE